MKIGFVKPVPSSGIMKRGKYVNGTQILILTSEVSATT